MKKKRKILLKIIIVVVAVVLIWNHLPYYYSNDRAVEYITNHAEPKSTKMCALYVMLGMWYGGCPVSCVALPAYAYEKILPQEGFQEISMNGYVPKKGDISVLPRNSKHVYGHIAVYNGKQWVSDFKQHSLFPSKAYIANGKCKIFRISDGWHWKHVWTSPVDWYDWIRTGTKGLISL